MAGVFSMPPAVQTPPAPVLMVALQAMLGMDATVSFSQIPAKPAPPALGVATTGPFSKLPVDDMF